MMVLAGTFGNCHISHIKVSILECKCVHPVQYYVKCHVSLALKCTCVKLLVGDLKWKLVSLPEQHDLHL